MAFCTRVLIDSGCRAWLRAVLSLPTLRNTGPSVMPASCSQAVRAVTGQRSGLPGPGEHDELGLLAGGVGLGPRQAQDEPVGVLGDVVDGQGGELTAAQRGDEPDQQQ